MSVYRRIVLCLAVTTLLAGVGHAQQGRSGEAGRPVLQGVDLSDRQDEERISILIEVGMVLPSIPLLKLGQNSDIVLEITHGPAEFLYLEDENAPIQRVKRVAYRSNTVTLPQVLVGDSPESRESSLSIQVDGVPVGDTIRLAVLEEGLIEGWWTQMKSAQPAIVHLVSMAKFVVADMKKFDWDELPGDVKELEQKPRNPNNV